MNAIEEIMKMKGKVAEMGPEIEAIIVSDAFEKFELVRHPTDPMRYYIYGNKDVVFAHAKWCIGKDFCERTDRDGFAHYMAGIEVIEGVRIAAKNGIQNLAYIEGILKRRGMGGEEVNKYVRDLQNYLGE